MTAHRLAAPLLGQEIFQGLSPLQITEIARRAEKVIFNPGQTLIESGEIGDAAVLIVSGKATMTAGPRHDDKDEEIEPGSLLGEMAMLIDKEHTSTVIAKTPVKAMRINRDDLRDQMLEDPGLAEHMASKIGARVDGLIDQLRKIELNLAEAELESDKDLDKLTDRADVIDSSVSSLNV